MMVLKVCGVRTLYRRSRWWSCIEDNIERSRGQFFGVDETYDAQISPELTAIGSCNPHAQFGFYTLCASL